jgi:hypothetical protein
MKSFWIFVLFAFPVTLFAEDAGRPQKREFVRALHGHA